ncbi:hypothetical protein ABT369_32245 [Dactylosporangium sp. NPDC000244]|uniref:hypothetical protein n=1 Tax=Dactylosporangium sp. NPDC000244 TaxID=3154365 RepID=UPI003327E5B8
MTEVPVLYSPWYVLGVFLANGIGCVLTVFCLVRMTDERRSTANRAVLVVGAAWGLIETARDDALFVLATAIHLRDDQVQFFLAPGLALTVGTILISVVVLGVAAAWPRPLWTVAAGVTVGLLTSAMIVQSMLSGRSGYVTSINAPAAVAIAAGLTAVIATAVYLATGATRRWRMAGPILVVGLAMTVAQYLMAGQVTIDFAATVDNAAGASPITLIFITVAAFGVRMIALTLLSITDEGRVEQQSEAYEGTRRAH